jgi:hypothetical protein
MISTSYKKEFNRKALTNHAKSMIEVTAKEDYKTYFLGSSDRKTYTVELTAYFLDKKPMYSRLDIAPWIDQQTANELVEEAKQELRNRYANSLYQDGEL